MLDELTKDELEEWMAWFRLKQMAEQEDRENAAMEDGLAASVEDGILRAKSWR